MSIDLESLTNQDYIEDAPSPLRTTIASCEEADLPPQMLLPVVTRTHIALYQLCIKEIKPLWKQDNNLLFQVPCSHTSKAQNSVNVNTTVTQFGEVCEPMSWRMQTTGLLTLLMFPRNGLLRPSCWEFGSLFLTLPPCGPFLRSPRGSRRRSVIYSPNHNITHIQNSISQYIYAFYMPFGWTNTTCGKT